MKYVSFKVNFAKNCRNGFNDHGFGGGGDVKYIAMRHLPLSIFHFC